MHNINGHIKTGATRILPSPRRPAAPSPPPPAYSRAITSERQVIYQPVTRRRERSGLRAFIYEKKMKRMLLAFRFLRRIVVCDMDHFLLVIDTEPYPYYAQSKGGDLRVRRCSLKIHSSVPYWYGAASMDTEITRQGPSTSVELVQHIYGAWKDSRSPTGIFRDRTKVLGRVYHETMTRKLRRQAGRSTL
ncbi:hypothetical protein EVAR_23296_1 [Eumeta japonica]|uniref:Uncharacterized protein n=1 Tax=Eumeta variegata TaxID=151549 RepID=A0A4C1V5R4_EUMVA|nr:hypothetical protein EVAR_23296_1 [Eumeta japonica]